MTGISFEQKRPAIVFLTDPAPIFYMDSRAAMMVDAHLHFWKLSRGDYTFPLPSDPLLYNDFLPSDLSHQLVEADIRATIAVQATETRAETEFLLALAAQSGPQSGIVGWCDLSTGTDACDHLADLRKLGPLVGIRPMLQKSDDAEWLLEPNAETALHWMAENGLAFDALVDARHLSAMTELASRHPGLHIIVNHFGKPWRHPERFQMWEDCMRSLATLPNIWIKISGFPARSDRDIKLPSLDALVQFLTAQFGTHKLIWGSDWPVSLRHWTYQDALEAMQHMFPIKERNKVFHTNALRAYRIDPVSRPPKNRPPLAKHQTSV